jgi:hypothetical protein
VVSFKQADGTLILFSTKFGRMSYEDDDELKQGVFSHFLVRSEQRGLPHRL